MNKRELKKPSLRYPGFEGSWQRAQLGDYLEFKNGFNAEKSQYGTGTKFINVLDVINDSPIRYDSIIGKVTMSETEFVKYEVKFGDILFQRSSETREEVGQSNVYLDTTATAAFGGFVIRGTAKQSYEPLFLYYLLKTASVRKEITSRSGGSTRYNIGQENLRDVRIFLPTQSEQQKIAAFLLAVDEKIGFLAKKRELLLKYKKGVTQQIFDQKIRFKDDNGNDFPNWKRLKIEELADRKVRWSFTGGPFGSNLKTEDYTETGVRIVQLQNIGDGEFLDSYKIFTTPTKADELLSCNIYPGEIIISKMGDPVARACILPRIENDRFLMASDGIRLRVDGEQFIPKFILDSINFSSVRKQAFCVSTGSTRRRIGLDDLRNLTISVPSREEQRKIADFLSAIDDKINKTERELRQTKAFKVGLLQQMFV